MLCLNPGGSLLAVVVEQKIQLVQLQMVILLHPSLLHIQFSCTFVVLVLIANLSKQYLQCSTIHLRILCSPLSKYHLRIIVKKTKKKNTFGLLVSLHHFLM